MCEVEPTPKGWFIKYIDRSPAVLAREQVCLHTDSNNRFVYSSKVHRSKWKELYSAVGGHVTKLQLSNNFTCPSLLLCLDSTVASIRI